MLDKRLQFLSTNWAPYPQPCGEGWEGGEFLHLEQAEGEVRIVVGSQSQTRSLRARQVRLQGSQAPVGEILRSGDKIFWRSVEEELELVLAAPCLAEWQPHRGRPEWLKAWPEFLQLIREFFAAHQFVEMTTPTLVACPGLEPTLEPMVTQVRLGGQEVRRYLPTSPELSLKKLLAQGWQRIFEIRSCFRDGEISDHHEPEFTMLEFYRAYENLDAIEGDLRALFAKMQVDGWMKESLGHWQILTVAELFQKCFQFDLRCDTTREQLIELAEEYRISVSADDSWNDVFHRLWLERIEPWLAEEKAPILVKNFPPSQAALARISAEGWAERMELFWCGLEIANGFQELNDPVEQERRFRADLEEKKRLNKRHSPSIDEEFLQAMRAGMPPAAGIAVGLERLFMAALGIEKIQELKAFAYGRSKEPNHL